MRYMGKQGLCGFHFQVPQLFWWPGHGTSRVPDTQVCLRLSPCKEGAQFCSTAQGGTQKNLACFPLRFNLDTEAFSA